MIKNILTFLKHTLIYTHSQNIPAYEVEAKNGEQWCSIIHVNRIYVVQRNSITSDVQYM